MPWCGQSCRRGTKIVVPHYKWTQAVCPANTKPWKKQTAKCASLDLNWCLGGTACFLLPGVLAVCLRSGDSQIAEENSTAGYCTWAYPSLSLRMFVRNLGSHFFLFYSRTNVLGNSLSVFPSLSLSTCLASLHCNQTLFNRAVFFLFFSARFSL